MSKEITSETAASYLNKLCCEIPERPVGSSGNREATEFFSREISSFGWAVETQRFDAIDWTENGVRVTDGDESFTAFASPYSLGCRVEAELTAVSTLRELEEKDTRGRILLLHGEIAKEQLMPKNFVFYNPDEHKRIVSLLENSGAEAIITATGRNSSLAGGAYPFPMIEDGDFDIPSVYMTDVEGERLLGFEGKKISFISDARRIESYGYNVIGRKGSGQAGKVVVTAHIDAKKGTPGAIDNATGVIVLLLLARMLKDYEGEKQIELVAFNGEDYYAVSGQMEYIRKYQHDFGNIMLNINIDGAGYFEGESACSFYNLPAELKEKAESILSKYTGHICEGPQWPQGDHSIFVQFGCAAMAFTSKWFTDNMETQDVTHTKKDNPSIVDVNKLQPIAQAIQELLLK